MELHSPYPGNFNPESLAMERAIAIVSFVQMRRMGVREAE